MSFNNPSNVFGIEPMFFWSSDSKTPFILTSKADSDISERFRKDSVDETDPLGLDVLNRIWETESQEKKIVINEY